MPGAFHTTPIESLNMLADEFPLSLRRNRLTLQHYSNTRIQINNPALNHIANISDKRLFAPKKYMRAILSTRGRLAELTEHHPQGC